MELLFKEKKIIFPEKYFIDFRARNQKNMVDPKSGIVKSPVPKSFGLDDEHGYVIVMIFPDGTENSFFVPRDELRVEDLS